MAALIPVEVRANPTFPLCLQHRLAFFRRHFFDALGRFLEFGKEFRIGAVRTPFHATSIACLAAVVTLAACTTTRGSFCDIARPIRPANVDVLTDAEVADILAHNSKGAKLCGWRP